MQRQFGYTHFIRVGSQTRTTFDYYGLADNPFLVLGGQEGILDTVGAIMGTRAAQERNELSKDLKVMDWRPLPPVLLDTWLASEWFDQAYAGAQPAI